MITSDSVKEALVLLTFRDCELDARLYTLRRAGLVCQIEPLVFNLLLYLAQHRDRIVSRQELMDALWSGKIVSESTLSSCIKSARQAVGDNGEAQHCIATVNRRGYRFVAAVESKQASSGEPLVFSHSIPSPVPELDEDRRSSARRASLAVMPFADLTPGSPIRGGIADALAHDVITRLAQLRSLFVIAQGTVFALHEQNVRPDEAGRLLKVDYVVSGTVRRRDQQLIVTAELIETKTARIVWAGMFDELQTEALQVLDEIGSKIVSTTANEIELAERNRAILKPPSSLDAWEAHHRGLWHMYRFGKQDNEQARQFFNQAVILDPTFARAHAGLSFTHFQNAFQGWGPRDEEIGHAFQAAVQSLVVDDRDPAAHWAMGRALWLRGQHGPSILELEQTIDLSPSFALGHYTLAFVQSQSGDPEAAIRYSDHSRLMSPFDPLLFGMLGARAIALVRLEQFEEAARWAVKAASRPNTPAHSGSCVILSGTGWIRAGGTQISCDRKTSAAQLQR